MSIRTTNFDALAASAPLDRQASVIRDASGDQWEPKLHTPPPRFDAPPLPISALPKGLPDLSGRVFGRMTVIRYHGRIGKNGRWLCRCTCGTYELRRSKSVVADHRPDHGCASCEYLLHLRYRASAPSTQERRASDATMLDGLAQAVRS